MSQKTTLEGTYRWIPVAQELPDDSETVLVCNLEDWDDPVDTGYYCAQEWHRGYFSDCPLDGKGYTEDGDPYPDPSWNPPTHWMRLPEPPGLAIVPGPPAYKNPFKVENGIVCVAYDQIEMVKKFSAMQCLDALCLPDLGKSVRNAIEVRLRKIAKKGASK